MTSILSLSYKLLILSWITAKRQLIHNRTAQRSTWDQSYDFIVVGAGASGCVVANRLTENPSIRVLLLDAGRPQDAIYNDIPGIFLPGISEQGRLQWNYYYEVQHNFGQSGPNGRIYTNMGRTIGGSSAHNGMNFYRGNPRDYDTWANIYGAKGWSFKELLPYFRRSENNTDPEIVRNNPEYHSTKGAVQISSVTDHAPILYLAQKVFNNLGFPTTDFNGRNTTGTMFPQLYVSPHGFRTQAANSYVSPNPHPNNLHIVANAMVTKILFNGLTAVGVEFVRNATNYRVYTRREVIVSAGPFQTPPLLMLSGIGPQQHLREKGIKPLIDLPVGDNLAHHLTIELYTQADPNLTHPIPTLSIDQLSQLYFNSSGPLSEFDIISLYLSTRLNVDKQWPNAMFSIYFNQGTMALHTNVLPLRFDGKVRLQSNNPFIQPLLYMNVLQDPNELANLVDVARFTLFIMEATPLSQYLIRMNFSTYGCPTCSGRPNYECEEGILCYIRKHGFVEHPCGSCRMGDPNRDDTVVNPTLQVKHAQNLRVCDSSVISKIPNAGTNCASLMIGEKCAQIIKNYHRIN